MARRDAQPFGVRQRLDGGGAEEAALLVPAAPPSPLGGEGQGVRGQDPIDDLGDLLAAEDADDVIDLGHFLEQVVLLRSAKQPATTTATTRPRRFSSSISRMTPSDSWRAGSMKPQVLTTTTSAPSASGVRVAVLGQLAQHALRIHQDFSGSRG